jgi:hypothetical protein
LRWRFARKRPGPAERALLRSISTDHVQSRRELDFVMRGGQGATLKPQAREIIESSSRPREKAVFHRLRNLMGEMREAMFHLRESRYAEFRPTAFRWSPRESRDC